MRIGEKTLAESSLTVHISLSMKPNNSSDLICRSSVFSLMKTRSAIPEPPNIAAIVKARHHARVSSPLAGQNEQSVYFTPAGENIDGMGTATYQCVSFAQSGLAVTTTTEDTKNRSDGAPRILREAWSAEDRRLFFQGVRLYGRNFTEITRFIRSRGHRISVETSNTTPTLSGGLDHPMISGSGSIPASNMTSSTSLFFPSSAGGPPGLVSVSSSTTVTGPCVSDQSHHVTGKTREQVRLFYWQTWQKIRRFLKFPDSVPQHVREVYALINYSVLRSRIKKPLDHRLGEKLNELIHCGFTAIRHNGRRFLLRTPACQALKQLNNITAPPHEFLLPEDVWIELVPQSQADLWRVLEAEQNPRVRLRVDLNRQLSDVLRLVESKWQLAAERMQALFDLPVAQPWPVLHLLVRSTPSQSIDGAIRLKEVPRVRCGDVALRCYIERQSVAAATAQAQAPSVTDGVSSPAPTDSTNPDNPSDSVDYPTQPIPIPQPPPPSSTSSASILTAELDLREIGRQLTNGVTYETSRGIKIVTVFLALGCPERMRFEYSFVPDRNDLPPPQDMPLLYRPPRNLEGQGISNGLRRLLHLNASDYLLHRDWLSSQSVLTKSSTTPRPTATCAKTTASTTLHSSPSITVTAGTSPLICGLQTSGGNPLTPSVSSSSALINPSTSVASPAIAVIAPTQVPISTPVTLPTPSSTVVSPVKVLTTVAAKPVSLVTSMPTCSPSVVLLSNQMSMMGRVPVVERQLDHQRPAPSTATVASPVMKIPISRYSPGGTPRCDPTMASNGRPVVSVIPRSEPGANPPTSRQSSLSTIKAHNLRRRETTVGRGPRRLSKAELLKLAASNSSTSAGSPLIKAQLTPTPRAPKVPIPSLISSSPVTRPIAPAPPPSSSATTSHATTTLLHQTRLKTTPPDLPLPDGDVSLGSLLDPGASNQSALSTDTLASLWNSICPPGSVDTHPTSTDLNSILQASNNVITTTGNSRTTDLDFTSNVNCKREDVEPHWASTPFTMGLSSCSATPSLPPTSPAFGDISLTDSMAAVLMETQPDESNSRDFEPSLTDLGSPMINVATSMPVATLNHPTTIPITCIPNADLLRIIASPGTPDCATIDLNNLLHTISINSTHVPTQLPPNL